MANGDDLDSRKAALFETLWEIHCKDAFIRAASDPYEHDVDLELSGREAVDGDTISKLALEGLHEALETYEDSASEWISGANWEASERLARDELSGKAARQAVAQAAEALEVDEDELFDEAVDAIRGKAFDEGLGDLEIVSHRLNGDVQAQFSSSFSLPRSDYEFENDAGDSLFAVLPSLSNSSWTSFCLTLRIHPLDFAKECSESALRLQMFGDDDGKAAAAEWLDDHERDIRSAGADPATWPEWLRSACASGAAFSDFPPFGSAPDLAPLVQALCENQYDEVLLEIPCGFSGDALAEHATALSRFKDSNAFFANNCALLAMSSDADEIRLDGEPLPLPGPFAFSAADVEFLSESADDENGSTLLSHEKRALSAASDLLWAAREGPLPDGASLPEAAAKVASAWPGAAAWAADRCAALAAERAGLPCPERQSRAAAAAEAFESARLAAQAPTAPLAERVRIGLAGPVSLPEAFRPDAPGAAAELSAVDALGNTLLHKAAYLCDWRSVEALAAAGADLKATNAFGQQPIDAWACAPRWARASAGSKADLQCGDRLCSGFASEELSGLRPDGRSLILRAFESRSSPGARLLASKGADPSARMARRDARPFLDQFWNPSAKAEIEEAYLSACSVRADAAPRRPTL